VKSLVLAAETEGNLRRAAELLSRGGLVAFPTDTVYGLGAAAFNGDAVRSLYSAKDRSGEKAIPILLSAASEIDLVAVNVDSRARRLAQRFWPGPLTIVVPKHGSVPKAIAESTVGIRVPDHAIARTLISLAGPLAVTSANLAGHDSPVTALEVLEQLGGRVGLILDGGVAPGGVASTVVDCTKAELVILRRGPLTLEELRAALD